MLPVRVEAGLTTDFLPLKNQNACCFGIKPKANEWVVVQSRPGPFTQESASAPDRKEREDKPWLDTVRR